MAQAELSGIAERLADEYPQTNANRGIALTSLAEFTTGDVRNGLYVMFGAVGLVLLIACANVANLLLARGSMRLGEIAVRTTLGASRATIVRQLLVESLMLSMTGAILGVFLSVWGVQALVALSPGNIPRLDNVTVDGTVILFSAALAILVAAVFGTVPAFRLAKSSISGVVRDGRDPETGLGHKRALRSGLLVLEMAISLMLLVGAGLLLRSFAQIHAVDLGIDPSGVQQFSLSLPEARYEGERAAVFFKSLEERLATIPGAEAVGMISGSPLGHSHSSIGFDIVGREPFAPQNQPFFLVRRATPGYFESVRIPLLAGRSFNAEDTGETPRVAIISSTAAERFFPSDDPIGKQFTFDQGVTNWTIVGVVGDVRSIDVTTETEPEAYFPLAQWSGDFMTVLVRTTDGVSSIVPQLRSEVAALDPLLAMYWIETLDHRVDVSVGQERFNLLLLGTFAGLALVLAAVGLYGVVAYLVTRRTREIGIRIALGACWRDVARLVLWQGMLPTLAGTALGLMGAVVGTRVLSSLLYQVEPWDPTTFVAGTTVLFAVALLACFVPVRGATKIPPTEAIRVE
jgi:putative ABC transport system permease protein